MKNIIYLVLFSFVLCLSCKPNAEEFIPVTSVTTLDYAGLKPLLEKKDQNIYVVNFWATWCAPCVKELPYFEKIRTTYKDQNVKVILVSLDFPKQVERKLIPFINEHKLRSELYLLDDPNESFWIEDISNKWSGALPATLIFNGDKRAFFEQSFTYESLVSEVQSFLK